MRRTNTGRGLLVRLIASLLFAGLAGASMVSLTVPDVAEAQSEPNTAANGVVLPPLDYDPAAARNENLVESVAAQMSQFPVLAALTRSIVPTNDRRRSRPAGIGLSRRTWLRRSEPSGRPDGSLLRRCATSRMRAISRPYAIFCCRTRQFVLHLRPFCRILWNMPS